MGSKRYIDPCRELESDRQTNSYELDYHSRPRPTLQQVTSNKYLLLMVPVCGTYDRRARKALAPYNTIQCIL